MIFKCKNCGGNVVYDPAKEKMLCPYCDGEDSQEVSDARQGLAVCSNCGFDSGESYVVVKYEQKWKACPMCEARMKGADDE